MSKKTRTTAIAKPGYWNPYVAGGLLGLVLFASFALTGHGLGASGGLTRILAVAEGQIAPEHTAQNPELAKVVSGTGNPLDHWLVWLMVGVVIGGLVSGIMSGRFKLETIHGPNISPQTRLFLALFGGTLVGIGARMARGCTSGQALSGGVVLSVGSFLFMLAVFAGGYLLAYPVRRWWN